MKNRIRLISLELKLNYAKILLCSVVSICLLSLAMTMADFSGNVPKVLRSYILIKADLETYDVTCSWMNIDELAYVKQELEKEGLEFSFIDGEANHISGTFSTNDLDQCIRITEKLNKKSFAVHCDAYEITKTLFDDIRFFEKLFRGLFAISFIAFLTAFFSFEMTILLSGRRRLRMLYCIGWSRLRLWLCQTICAAIGLIPVTLAAFFLGRKYEKFASLRVKELFEDQVSLHIPPTESWHSLSLMIWTAVICISLIIFAYIRKSMLTNEERIS